MDYATEEIFYCPSVPRNRTWNLILSGTTITYGLTNWFVPMSGTIGGVAYSWGATSHNYYQQINASRLLVRLNAIDYPSQGMLVSDRGKHPRRLEALGNKVELWEVEFFSPTAHPNSHAPGMHGDNTNAVFFDGHVESRHGMEFWPHYRWNIGSVQRRTYLHWPFRTANQHSLGDGW